MAVIARRFLPWRSVKVITASFLMRLPRSAKSALFAKTNIPQFNLGSEAQTLGMKSY